MSHPVVELQNKFDLQKMPPLPPSLKFLSAVYTTQALVLSYLTSTFILVTVLISEQEQLKSRKI